MWLNVIEILLNDFNQDVIALDWNYFNRFQSQSIKINHCSNFPTRSLLWQLVFTVVKYGPLLLWHMIPQKSPPHMSFILAFWKDSWVSRKALILTACSAKQVRCPSFSIGSDASYVSGTVYSLQTILFLRKLCRLTSLLQIETILDISGSARTPRFPCVPEIFECHTISRVYQFETVWTHSARK